VAERWRSFFLRRAEPQVGRKNYARRGPFVGFGALSLSGLNLLPWDSAL
jgi:hypothetical protein